MGVDGYQLLDDAVTLLDVSDPRAPRQVLLDAANLVDAGGTTTLSLDVDQAAPGARRFLALAGDPVYTLTAFPYFKASRVAYPGDPADAAEAPDVLVITHPTFRAEAERWAEYRAGSWPQTLSIHIADIHAIYDWYSGGLKNPDAIRRFCAEVQARHGTWALQIFGDANENVKGLSDPNNLRDWVPSHWHCWERGSYANALLPSDKWFVNSGAGPTDDYPFDTVSLPEMIVGRFPANSVAEAANLVDKVIAFESSDADWKKHAIFIADDAWSDGYTSNANDQGYRSYEEDFEETQEIAATNWETFALPGEHGVGDEGFVSERIYLTTDLEPLSPPHNETRSRTDFRNHAALLTLPRLLAAANRGATFVHYQGHGSETLLAHEQVVEDIRNSPLTARTPTASTTRASPGSSWASVATSPPGPGRLGGDRLLGRALAGREAAASRELRRGRGLRQPGLRIPLAQRRTRPDPVRPDAPAPASRRPHRRRAALPLAVGERPQAAEAVRVIQPNAAQHEKWDPDLIPVFFRRQMEYTSAAPRPDLIVWPETAIPVLLNNAAPTLEAIAQAAGGTPVVLGAQRLDGVKLHNSLVLTGPAGQIDAIYDKHHLVPFGEYIPFGSVLSRFGLRGMAAKDGNGYASGPGPQIIDMGSLGRALPLICYEGVFP